MYDKLIIFMIALYARKRKNSKPGHGFCILISALRTMCVRATVKLWTFEL
jgi:hypothetical protein